MSSNLTLIFAQLNLKPSAQIPNSDGELTLCWWTALCNQKHHSPPDLHQAIRNLPFLKRSVRSSTKSNQCTKLAKGHAGLTILPIYHQFHLVLALCGAVLLLATWPFTHGHAIRITKALHHEPAHTIRWGDTKSRTHPD